MKRFNIRAYGVFIEQDRLLVTDEIRLGIKMTKLPGGGLEFGEGLEACLKREWKEELLTEIEVGDVLFVNPFLQPSAFHPQEEILAIYFSVVPVSPLIGEFREKKFGFDSEDNNQQVFRWIPLDALSPEDFTFPIDQAMVPRLIRHIHSS